MFRSRQILLWQVAEQIALPSRIWILGVCCVCCVGFGLGFGSSVWFVAVSGVVSGRSEQFGQADQVVGGDEAAGVFGLVGGQGDAVFGGPAGPASRSAVPVASVRVASTENWSGVSRRSRLWLNTVGCQKASSSGRPINQRTDEPAKEHVVVDLRHQLPRRAKGTPPARS